MIRWARNEGCVIAQGSLLFVGAGCGGGGCAGAAVAPPRADVTN